MFLDWVKAVNNKRFARATVLLMQDGQFAWPHLDALWYQASIYKETGEGHLSLADDTDGGRDLRVRDGTAHRGRVVGQAGEPLSLEQHRATGRAG
jgi:hypothetical protein